MSKTIFIAPVFFLPIPQFLELWGGPKGTGYFRMMESMTGVPIDISEKTIRRTFQDRVPPSKSTERKIKQWSDNLIQKHYLLKDIFEYGKSLIGLRHAEADWRGALKGLSIGANGRVYPRTLEYIGSILDDEAEYYRSAQVHRDQPEAFLRRLLTESFFTKYGLPISEQIIHTVTEQVSYDPIENLTRQPEVNHSLIFGLISLQMDILAHAEVEWFIENIEQLQERNLFKSQLSKLLPKVIGNKISSPVTSFFHLLRKHFDISSWNAMAETMVMDGQADIESKRRKLMGWVQGDHSPNNEKVFEFLKQLVQTKGDYSSIYYDDLYLASAFVNRLLHFVLPSAIHFRMQAKQLTEAFSTYDKHFSRHMAAATI